MKKQEKSRIRCGEIKRIIRITWNRLRKLNRLRQMKRNETIQMFKNVQQALKLKIK